MWRGRSFYATRHNVGQSIPVNNLYVGMKVHLSYTNFGCYWVITHIESPDRNGETWLKLRAPESGKTKRTRASYATYIRADQR